MRLSTRLSKGAIAAAFVLLVAWPMAGQKPLGSGEAGMAQIPPPGAWAAPDRVIVLFAGDIMLDRNVAVWREENPASMFEGVRDLFESADYRVANLEGPITANASIARRDSGILRFTFDPGFARAAIAPLNLSAVSLANNHAYDFGRAGYAQTQDYLAQWGIGHFGHPYNATSSLSTVLQTPLGALCLVGYHALYGSDIAPVAEAISTLRSHCWRIAVVAHWGEEYRTRETPEQTRAARAFVDAGADAVVGAHPHVAEPYETYRGKAIFYSLGNFMFDQEFSPEVMRGLLVRAELGPTQSCFTPVPVSIAHAAVRAEEPLDTFCLP